MFINLLADDTPTMPIFDSSPPPLPFFQQSSSFKPFFPAVSESTNLNSHFLLKTPDTLIKTISKYAFDLVLSSFQKEDLLYSTLTGKRSHSQLDPNIINIIKQQTITTLRISEGNWSDSWKTSKKDC